MENMVSKIASDAKLAANKFSAAGTEAKNVLLTSLAKLLLDNKNLILSENAKDVALATQNGRNEAFIDRLTLNEKRINAMAEGLEAVAALSDPVGKTVDEKNLENGLTVRRVRAPLGVIGIIFEARPNVAIDAFSLCFKSGNGVVLRGSRDSKNSVNCLVTLVKSALDTMGMDGRLIGNVEGDDRSFTIEMLKQSDHIDVIIPRGGEGLKKVVLENATMPVIASSGGNCHQYISESADKKLATDVMINAKINRPSTCNALETVLFDRKLSAEFVRESLGALAAHGVEIRGSEEINKVYASCKVIDEDEFYTEYIDMIIKAAFVDNVDEAIAHINKYGTHHSDAIISRDENEIARFFREVDSAAVYSNASTRFTDGFEFGLGAEMGISTQKLHVRGPVALEELTSVKYNIIGSGQTRA